ncbi:MAG: GxxExxY protein [Melioribacteraceae bacterium]|nr:GxxExxY protein [Melioribacteraceae bacterium]
MDENNSVSQNSKMIFPELSNKIIKAYYNVYNTLGYGFLEKVYENALKLELQEMGMYVEQLKNIRVYYKGKEVGDYFADLIVDKSIIIELKAAESICEEHEAQLLNYLRATTIELGFLFNYGKKAEFKRKIFTNDKK